MHRFANPINSSTLNWQQKPTDPNGCNAKGVVAGVCSILLCHGNFCIAHIADPRAIEKRKSHMDVYCHKCGSSNNSCKNFDLIDLSLAVTQTAGDFLS